MGALLLGGCLLVIAEAGAGPVPPATDQAANSAAVLKTFQGRVEDYVKLHRRLEAKLPKLKDDADPKAIHNHQVALAELIRAARPDATRGDLFTAEIVRAIRHELVALFRGPGGANLRGSVMDENPMSVQLAVNQLYPTTVPLSTVPPQILLTLPTLPEEVEYRFVRKHLVLRDPHANLIVDFTTGVVP